MHRYLTWKSKCNLCSHNSRRVPLKERVMIIKRKRGIKIKLRREQHQEHKSREKNSAEQCILAVFSPTAKV